MFPCLHFLRFQPDPQLNRHTGRDHNFSMERMQYSGSGIQTGGIQIFHLKNPSRNPQQWYIQCHIFCGGIGHIERHRTFFPVHHPQLVSAQLFPFWNPIWLHRIIRSGTAYDQLWIITGRTKLSSIQGKNFPLQSVYRIVHIHQLRIPGRIPVADLFLKLNNSRRRTRYIPLFYNIIQQARITPPDTVLHFDPWNRFSELIRTQWLRKIPGSQNFLFLSGEIDFDLIHKKIISLRHTAETDITGIDRRKSGIDFYRSVFFARRNRSPIIRHDTTESMKHLAIHTHFRIDHGRQQYSGIKSCAEYDPVKIRIFLQIQRDLNHLVWSKIANTPADSALLGPKLFPGITQFSIC